MQTLKKYIFPIILVAGLSIWMVLKLINNKEKLDTKANIGNTKTHIFPVTTTTPRYETLANSYTSSGIFIPVNAMAVMSDISGRILTTSIKDGVRIVKAQTIVTVFNEQEEISKQQNTIEKNLATQSLQKAKADFAKLENMYKVNAVTSQQVEDQKAIVSAAEARLSTLGTTNRSTTVKAPISGIVHKAYVQVGSYLAPGTILADIVDNSSLKLQIPLSDKDVVKLSIGKKIQVVPDLYPDKKMIGSVVYIAAQADASRNFMVEVQIPNSATHPLKAGMSGTAIITNDNPQKALMIPIKSIVGGLQEPQVYVLNGDVATLTKITTGYVQGDKVVVLNGITATDKIIETGQVNISNGSKVQVIN